MWTWIVFVTTNLPPAPPLVSVKHNVESDDANALHMAALSLTSDPLHLPAAQALLDAAIAMKPQDARMQSDLGVVHMRQTDWLRAWASFGRALKIDPSLVLPKKNREQLMAFLGGSSDIVVDNNLEPPRREPRTVEHQIETLTQRATLPTDPGEWARPMVLEAQPKQAAWPHIERHIVDLMPRRNADCALRSSTLPRCSVTLTLCTFVGS